jgi:hypothetical protein
MTVAKHRPSQARCDGRILESMIEFTPVELEAFARMVTTMLRADGEASEAEKSALVALEERVGSAIHYWLERAEPLGEGELATTARTITRKEAQEAIYEALYDLSASDLIAKQEWNLLKVLVDTWHIDA